MSKTLYKKTQTIADFFRTQIFAHFYVDFINASRSSVRHVRIQKNWAVRYSRSSAFFSSLCTSAKTFSPCCRTLSPRWNLRMQFVLMAYMFNPGEIRLTRASPGIILVAYDHRLDSWWISIAYRNINNSQLSIFWSFFEKYNICQLSEVLIYFHLGWFRRVTSSPKLDNEGWAKFCENSTH